MKSAKRERKLKAAGIAVCDMKCAACTRRMCTGARALEKGGSK